MTRTEYIKWCKVRALKYVDQNEPEQGFISMLSDLNNREETKNHIAIDLGMWLAGLGKMDICEETRAFIEGIN